MYHLKKIIENTRNTFIEGRKAREDEKNRNRTLIKRSWDNNLKLVPVLIKLRGANLVRKT